MPLEHRARNVQLEILKDIFYRKEHDGAAHEDLNELLWYILLRLRAEIHAHEPADAEKDSQGPVRHGRSAVRRRKHSEKQGTRHRGDERTH